MSKESKIFTLTPVSFLETLENNVQGFKGLSFEHKLRLAHIFSKYYLSDEYKHRNGEGIFYPRDVLYKHFSKGYAKLMRTFFIVDESYRYDATTENNYTKRYTLKPEIVNVIDEHLKTRTNQQTELLVNGKPFRNGNAITRLDIYGNMKKSTIKLPNITAVNVENLQRLSNYLSKAYDDMLKGSKPLKTQYSELIRDKEKIEYYLRIVTELLRLSNIKPIPYGYMPLYYRETSTGRLQGQGVHLQNIPKLIRYEALKGFNYWQYDFENCHYSVLEQLSTNPLPTVNYYNTHKNEFRERLTLELGLSMDKVKTALIAIIYGASDSEGYAITEELGNKDKDFLNHELVKGLFNDIKSARTQIIRDTPVSRARVINAMSKGISVDENERTILAHILQGIESKMLQSAIENNLESTKLLLFDGWLSDKELSTSELENKVLIDTGFKVRIEAQKLPT